jgi:anti-anti-sigma factor
VPLYSCQRCGWATTSSWRDAVEGHGDGCPDCPGAVELVPLGGRPQENIAALERVGRPFEMRESTDLDGALRLTLTGGLDIVVADRLTDRLLVLRGSGTPVRIDLSELEFIDCSGMEALIDELASARRSRRSLEVDRPVSAPVKRVITFMDVASDLWPPEAKVPRPALRVIEGTGEGSGPEPPDAIREPSQSNGRHSFGLVASDPLEPGPRTPGATASPDR